MGPRRLLAAGARRNLERACGRVLRDAAELSGARLAELLVSADAPPAPRWRCIALAVPRASRLQRTQIARALARSPALDGLCLPRRGGACRVVTSDAGLADAVGSRALHEVFLPFSTHRAVSGWLRLAIDGRPDHAALRRYRALARQVSALIEADAVRRELAAGQRRAARDVTREKRALAELSQATETLGALNLAGTHLMVETDEAAIHGVICRELLRIGFASAVLTAEHGREGPRPPYRYTFTSFSAPVQRATERVLGHAVSELRIDPRTAPLVARVLREGRTIYTARARAAARQLLGDISEEGIRKLERLLALKHVVIAPLRYRDGISGLLVVAAARLRRSDPKGIDAFALQASIALEKARLFGELKRQQERLESEVQRRTVDLTRAVGALKELDRRKDNFLANVSHELRTPLVTVLGYTDLLLSEKLGELTARQRECLRVVATSARRLRSFIDELLEFSRHELTRDHLTFSTIDLRELVHQAAVSIAPRFHERGVRLRVRIAPGTPLAWGDRDRILQVIMNLLLNAERHCFEASYVRIAVAPGAPGRIDVAVSDQGQGIPPEHLAHIFDRLYQVGDRVKQREKGAGLGLGLAISKSIVEAHDGEIRVRSSLGRGTSFRFSLPAAGAGDVARAPTPGAQPLTSPAG